MQAVEGAIVNEAEALKRSVDADAQLLMSKLEAMRAKQVGVLSEAIDDMQHELRAICELLGAVDSVLRCRETENLMCKFCSLHSGASDIIQRHRQQVARRVVTVSRISK